MKPKKDKWTKAAEELVEFCHVYINEYVDQEEGKRDALKKAVRIIDRALMVYPICECGIQKRFHGKEGNSDCPKFKLDRSKTK